SGFLMSAVWPELTAVHARGQYEHLVRARRSLTKCNVWLVGAVTFGVLPFLPWIYPSWTVGRLTLDEWTLVFLTMRLVIWGMWSPSMTVLMATNRHQRMALVLLSAAGVTSLLAVALVPVMGIGGAALAALVADLCIPAWLAPFIASREIGDSPRQFMAEAGAGVIGGIGIPGGLGSLAWYLIPSLQLRYLLVLPMSVGMALALMWWQLMAWERQLVIHLGQKLLTNRQSLYSM